MTASTICALHCALVPILITFLPLAGLSFLAHPVFEWSMIILALLLGISSIFLSYFRTHRKALPMLLLVIGFAMIVLGHLYLVDWLEMIVVPIGGLTIAAAHFVNFKYVGVCDNNEQFFHLKHDHKRSRKV
jgi:hypothetical protein